MQHRVRPILHQLCNPFTTHNVQAARGYGVAREVLGVSISPWDSHVVIPNLCSPKRPYKHILFYDNEFDVLFGT